MIHAVVSAEFRARPADLTVEAGLTVAGLLAHAVRRGLITRDQLPLTEVWIDGRRLARTEAGRVLSAYETVHLNVTVHGGGGGGEKDVGQVLLQIAVLVVATFVGGPGGAAAALNLQAGSLLANVVNAAASTAVLAAGNAAIQALYAPEQQAARANDRYALQAAANQYRPWGPMPLLLGRQVVAPDLAVKTYTQTIGEDVWLHGILGVHYGPVAIDALKIGDTAVDSLAADEIRLAYHLEPGPRTWSIYPNSVDETQFSEELNEDGSTALVRAAGAPGERFEFDFAFPRGLWFNKTSNGKALDEDVVVQVRYRPIDDQGDPTGDWAPAPFPPATRYTGAALPAGALYFRNKVKEVWRVTRELTLPLGLYEFEFVRDVPDDGPDGGGVEQILLTAIRAIRFTPPIADETLSVIEFAVKATALNQGTLAPITLEAEPICDVWDGEAWGDPEPTSNPAALARWLVTGPAAAKPLPSDQADQGLGYWYEICASRGWAAGLRIAEPRSQAEVLQMLGQRGRAAVYWSGRALEASPFVGKLAPRQLFTGANLADHTWRIVYPEPVHALRVEFQNLDQDGDPDEVVVYAEGFGPPGPGLAPGLEPAVRVETFRIEGQCTIARAWRDGRWEMADRRYRRRVDSWTCDIDQLACRLGDRVRLSWLGIRHGLGQARVRCRRWSGGQVVGVRLDHPVEMEAGKAYAIDARRIEGLATALPVQTTPGQVRELVLATPMAPEDAPAAGDLLAFGESGKVSVDVEIAAIEPQAGLRARLTGLRHVGDILDALDQEAVPEDLESGVTGARRARPPAPRLVAVQADPDGVRVAFSLPPWSGSPITGLTARWRWSPPDAEDGDVQAPAWQRLAALGADARVLVTPPVRALPAEAGDLEGETRVDIELVTVAANGAASDPLRVTGILVRDDPFPPVVTDVAGTVRTSPDGSKRGVLTLAAQALESGAQSELIVEVRERDGSGPTGDWRALVGTLPAAAPAGDFADVLAGQTYGVRTRWRQADGWLSDWTAEQVVTVPAASNVASDVVSVAGRPALDLLADVDDLYDVFGDTASSAANAALAEAAAAAAEAARLAADAQRILAQGAASSASASQGAAATSATDAAAAATTASVAATSSQQVANRLIPERVSVGADFAATFGPGDPNGTWTPVTYGTTPTETGEGQVRQHTANADLTTRGALPVVAGRRYRASVRSRVTVDGTGTRRDMWFRVFSASWGYLGVIGGVQTASHLASAGWTTLVSEVTADAVLAAYPTAAYVRANARHGANASNGNSGATWQASFLRLEDITAQANAATSEANALVYQNASAASAATALGAQAEATTQASLAAQVGQAALNAGATFAQYPTTPGLPTGWSLNAGATPTRVTGQASPYAVRIVGAAGAAAGIWQRDTGPGLQDVRPNQWLVFEADVTLVSGALTGAGVRLGGLNAANATQQTVRLTFATEADTSGAVPGAGTAGRTYRFRKLVQLTDANITKAALYAESHEAGHGSIAAANSLDWHRCAVRPATDSEIELRQARGGSASVSARITAEETARANGDAALATQISTVEAQAGEASAAVTVVSAALATLDGEVEGLWGVQVEADGKVSGLTNRNDGAVSAIDIQADVVRVRNSDGSAAIEKTPGGRVRIEGQNVADLALDLLGGAVGVEVTCSVADPTKIRLKARAARLVSTTALDDTLTFQNVDLELNWDTIGLNGRDSSPPTFEFSGVWGAIWLVSDGATVGAIWSRGEPVMPTGYTYRSTEPISEAVTLADDALTPNVGAQWRPYSQDDNEVLFLGLRASSTDLIIGGLPVIFRNVVLGANNSTPTWEQVANVRASQWGQNTVFPPNANVYRIVAKRGGGVLCVAPTSNYGNSDDPRNPPPIAIPNDSFSLVADVQPEDNSLWAISTFIGNEVRGAGYIRGRMPGAIAQFGISLDFASGTYQSKSSPSAALGTTSLVNLLTGTVRPGTLEGTSVATGALAEGGERNHCYSTAMEGAAVGTLGSGGALPTGWTTDGSIAVASVQVTEVAGGEIQIVVTPNGTGGDWVLQYEPTTAVTAVAGERWCGSYEVALMSAAPSVVFPFRSQFIERDGSGAIVSRHSRKFNIQGFAFWPAEQRHTYLAASGRLTHGLCVTFGATFTDPVTLRIRKPQLEKNDHRSSHIASSAGAGSRATDILQLTASAVTVMSSTAWSAVVGFRPGGGSSGTVCQWGTGSIGDYKELWWDRGLLKLRSVTGGVEISDTQIGIAPRWRETRVALAVKAGSVRVSVNGAPVLELPERFDEVKSVSLGFGQDKGALNGAIRLFEAERNSWWSVSTLRSKSSRPNQWYDDFLRADAANLIGTVAASGQTYGGVEPGENVAVVAPSLVAGRMVALASGTSASAAYLGVQLPAAATEFAFVGLMGEGGAAGDSWTIISSPNGLDDVADITNDSLHPTWTAEFHNLSYYDGGAGPAFVVANYGYDEPSLADGSTPYSRGYRINAAEGAVIIESHDGTLERFVNAAAVAQRGAYHFIEPYRFGGQAAGTPLPAAFLGVLAI